MASGHRGVVLGGFMGVGKTTVGQRLAARLELPFVDLDDVLVERFGAISEQFGEVGEATFRVREGRCLRTLCDRRPRVLATGGGAWVAPENRAALRTTYRLVVLQASWRTLEARLGGGEGRPLLSEARVLFDARQAAYADADHLVQTDDLSVDEVVARVLSALGGAEDDG